MRLRTDSKYTFILAAVLSIVLTSCSTVAFTGRHRLLVYPDSQITSLSDQSYSMLMDTVKLSKNTAQAALVESVGRRLTSALSTYLASTGETGLIAGLKWDYKLVQSREVNAFCMPNGKIVFYEGIMPYCPTADDVAVVMGHEIAHAIARHGNERMSQQSVLNVAGNVASAIIGVRTGADAQELFNLAYSVGGQYGVLLPFSRKHELEADEIGLIIMALAGYDVDKAPDFWERMSAGTRTSVPEVISTHPSNASRISAIRKAIPKARQYAAKVNGKPLPSGTATSGTLFHF